VPLADLKLLHELAANSAVGLAEQSELLRAKVDDFIHRVRAA